MARPILYTIHLSPPCRTVELCAKALGVDLDLNEMDLLGGEHLKPEFLKMNPQHTVPVLDDNGTIVCESHAIMIYLATKYGNNNGGSLLYPQDLAEQANVHAALFFESSMLFPRMRAIFEPVFFCGSSEISTEKMEYMQKAYKLLENTLINDYVVGNAVTIADFSCVSTISTVMGVVPLDEDKYPRIYAWLERMRSLPYYEEANGGGAVRMAQAVLATKEKNAQQKT